MQLSASRQLRVLLMAVVSAGFWLNGLPAAALTNSQVASRSLSGFVYSASGLCAGAFRVAGTQMCTHGPDPVPAPLLARGGPTPLSSAALMQAGTGVACDGDGESGKRVQALYVYVAGRPNRRAAYLSSFRAWAANVDAMFQASAAETGGNRRLRWVTNDTCQVSVTAVALSTAAETSFAATIGELTLQGYSRDDRKYLIWFDSDPRNSSMCGIGTVYVDDRQTGNINDAVTGYARADFACWNWSEPHELMHTLGAVQPTATHASLGLHCTDEYDQMCYPDNATAVMSYPCPASHDQVFDCGHDDYFSTSPAPNSYLSSHWNTADSGWLMSEAPDTTAPDVGEPRQSFVAGATLSSSARVRVHWPAASDESGIAAYELQSRKGSGAWANVELDSATEAGVELDLAVGATYSFRVRARDGAGNTGAWTATAAQTLTLLQENSTQVAYGSGFKRVALSGASGGYVRKATVGGSVATLSFASADVALVSTLGPNRGTAALRVDGGESQSVDLYDAATQTKRVVWVASVADGNHAVEVRVSGVANPQATGTRIDVDAFLVWKPAT